MKDVFITSTLHNNWNLEFNTRLCDELEKNGMSCHLPQRDTNQRGSEQERFSQNMDGIKNSRKLLVIALNETPNLGLETGFAYGLKKKIILITKQGHQVPLMVAKTGDIMEVENPDKIDSYIDKLVEKIKH